MQEATVSALKYDARPPLGSTALKVDGKSCDTQVSRAHLTFSDISAESFSSRKR